MTHKLNFNTHEIDTYFEIDEEDKDKYLVLTCAKNEDKYIIENSLIADDLLVLEPYTKSTDAKIKFNILK